MFGAYTRLKDQVSVFRTIGPLIYIFLGGITLAQTQHSALVLIYDDLIGFI